ncbi:MAG: hypothetical protein Q4B15_00395 [Lachnospiraceae bacterium]|nr:hypothetical protein [Lachnospiraceae bacterium]
MNDAVEELLVVRQPRPKEQMMKLLLIILTVLTAAAAFFFMFYLIFGTIAAAVGTYFVFHRTNAEYEYDYTNGELDVDIIYAKASRKHLMTLDMREIDCAAPQGSHHLDSYGSGYEEIDYSAGDPKDRPWTIVTSEGGRRRKVSVQLSEKMLNDMRMRTSGKVFFD